MKLDEAMMLVGDENTPRTQRIAAGALLWRFMDEATNALDALKRDLRAEAASLACSVVAFEGDDHSLCRVLVSPRTLKVREGVTVDAAREALGDAFDTVFEARLALRSSSPSALESLTEDAREALRAPEFVPVVGCPIGFAENHSAPTIQINSLNFSATRCV